MYEILNDLYWLNSWETNKKHNIEVGLDNRKLIKGYIFKNEFSCLEQLPNTNFFLKLEKLKPKLYAKNNFEYGELICYINNEKYRIVYYYDKELYIVIDSNDIIIRRIEK